MSAVRFDAAIVELDDSVGEVEVVVVVADDEDGFAALLYDKGRPLEIEAILGNPLRTAKTLKVSAPAITVLYQQLSFIDARTS